MSNSLSGLSASVTRILFLTGFPKELKTKDIQSAFSDWENTNGGFKIKWKDDTSLLIVFQDPSVAKRAYLHTIAFPPPILTSQAGGSAIIKPYDGPDAQSVIQNVNSRNQGANGNGARTSARSASISSTTNGRDRALSGSTKLGNYRNGNPLHLQMSSSGSIPEHPDGSGLSPLNGGREHSPTLPSLPTHPTLNALINSSLGEHVSHELPVDPAIVATSLDASPGRGPSIGDPGKRMVGAALGMRHPGLPPRVVNGNADQGMRDVQRAMSAVSVGE